MIFSRGLNLGHPQLLYIHSAFQDLPLPNEDRNLKQASPLSVSQPPAPLFSIPVRTRAGKGAGEIGSRSVVYLPRGEYSHIVGVIVVFIVEVAMGAFHDWPKQCISLCRPSQHVICELAPKSRRHLHTGI